MTSFRLIPERIRDILQTDITSNNRDVRVSSGVPDALSPATLPHFVAHISRIQDTGASNTIDQIVYNVSVTVTFYYRVVGQGLTYAAQEDIAAFFDQFEALMRSTPYLELNDSGLAYDVISLAPDVRVPATITYPVGAQNAQTYVGFQAVINVPFLRQ